MILAFREIAGGLTGMVMDILVLEDVVEHISVWITQYISFPITIFKQGIIVAAPSPRPVVYERLFP